MDEEEPMEISGDSFSLGSPTTLYRHSSASRSIPRRQSFPLNQQSRSMDRQFSSNRTPKRMSMSALQSKPKVDNSSGYFHCTPHHLTGSATELPPTLSEQVRNSSTVIRSLSDRFERQTKTRHRRYNHRPMNDEEEEDPRTSRKNQRKPFERKHSERCVSIKQKLAFMCFLMVLFLIINIVYRATPSSCKMTVDIAKLKDHLKKNVFGQHIASGLVMSLAKNMSIHFRKSLKSSHTVVSFHGWSGIGKNHMANILKQTFKPARVNTFLVPLHFPHRSQDDQYQVLIPQWIKGNISLCSMSVFIFDEMDKASEGVIQGLHAALTEIKNSNITNRVWTMFILLSNSRGTDINNYLFSQLEKGRERESLTQEEFMPTLISNAQGSWYLPFLEEGLITHTVPFLPLTQAHVKSCIIRDLYLKKMVPNKETIQKILEELPYNAPGEKGELYSVTGCKRVSSKVDLHMDD